MSSSRKLLSPLTKQKTFFQTFRLPIVNSSAKQPPSKQELKKSKTPMGRLDEELRAEQQILLNSKSLGRAQTSEQTQTAKQIQTTKQTQTTGQAQTKSSDDDPYAPFPEARNPTTGEIGGPRGPEPTRYGDWERKGRVFDF